MESIWVRGVVGFFSGFFYRRLGDKGKDSCKGNCG